MSTLTKKFEEKLAKIKNGTGVILLERNQSQEGLPGYKSGVKTTIGWRAMLPSSSPGDGGPTPITTTLHQAIWSFPEIELEDGQKDTPPIGIYLFNHAQYCTPHLIRAYSPQQALMLLAKSKSAKDNLGKFWLIASSTSGRPGVVF